MAPVPAPEFEAAIVNVFVPASFAVIVKFELSVPSTEIVEPSMSTPPAPSNVKAPALVVMFEAAAAVRLMPPAEAFNETASAPVPEDSIETLELVPPVCETVKSSASAVEARVIRLAPDT